MFLYTSLKILLYVVSIFNTSANVGSFDFIRNLNSPISLFHSDYFRIIILQQRSLSSQELAFAVPLTY